MMFIHTYQTQRINPNWSDYGWHVAAFMTPKENRAEITRWCYRTFGPAGRPCGATETRWKDSIRFGEVYFKNSVDLAWFVLRWA
jgi:hypothetical protein